MKLKNNDKINSKLKNKIKKKALSASLFVFVKIIPLLLIVATISTFVSWIVEIFTSKNTVDKVYETLEIEDVSNLVEIKGNETEGYYLDFVDDMEDRLDNTIKYLNSRSGVKAMKDKEFLKKLIKAEIYTQFPDLGGTIKTETGFQGAIDIIRISPDKDINSLTNTGAGEVTVINQDNQEDITNRESINKQETTIKTWKSGKKLKVISDAYVYEQKDSELHPSEKIDYWVKKIDDSTQKDIEIKEGEKVSYTGNYSISVNKSTNKGLIYIEVEKDNIKGYVKYRSISSDLNKNTPDVDANEEDDNFSNSGYIDQGEQKVVETINSKVYKLSYITKERFDEYIKNGDKSVLNYYTFDDGGNLIIASWSVREDGTIGFESNSSMNLKSSLQNIVMPWAYLLYFYIDTDYKGFSSDLADEVLKSKIVVALEDNVNTSYNKSITEERKLSSESEFAYSWKNINENESMTESCSTKVKVLYADTWSIKIINNNVYNDEISNIQNGEVKKIKIPGKVVESSYNEISEEVLVQEGNDKKKVNNEDINIPYKIYQQTETDSISIANSYDNSEGEVTSNESVFVNLFKQHKMYNRIRDKWLLNVLENDDRTANLVNLTKYFMYMATGKDYGVLEYDFSIYSEKEFSNVEKSSSDQLIRYIHYFEHSSPPPTNADGTKYIIEDDGKGHPTVGYGVDIYNSGYLSLFTAAGYPTDIGGEVDKDFVDSIEKKIIENKTLEIKSTLSGLNLTSYQLNALISRAYNCGTAGATGTRNGQTFLQAYEAYWNEDRDDYFKDKNNQADFNHSLYTNYMKDPATSRGEYMAGLEKRRKSEWTLFQTGYYDVLDEWHSDANSIVEVAKNIHEYMELNNYSYCVYGGNSYEECSKLNQSHGLNITFEQSKTGYKHSCCATYVSWVLQECGYISDSEHTDSANSMQNLLKNKGFIEIKNESELKPGDILCYSGHVEIYAGDNMIYNAGSGNAIRNSSPQRRTETFSYALRSPN